MPLRSSVEPSRISRSAQAKALSRTSGPCLSVEQTQCAISQEDRSQEDRRERVQSTLSKKIMTTRIVHLMISFSCIQKITNMALLVLLT